MEQFGPFGFPWPLCDRNEGKTSLQAWLGGRIDHSELGYGETHIFLYTIPTPANVWEDHLVSPLPSELLATCQPNFITLVPGRRVYFATEEVLVDVGNGIFDAHHVPMETRILVVIREVNSDHVMSNLKAYTHHPGVCYQFCDNQMGRHPNLLYHEHKDTSSMRLILSIPVDP